MFRPQTLAGLNSSLTLNPGTEASHGKYCQNGRPYLTDPATGQSLCLCQLDNHSAHSLQAHPALRGLRPIPPSSVNLADIHSYHQPQLTSLALGSAQNPGLMSTQLGYHPYMTMYAGVDVNGSPIRKAATRETTGPLKVWLSEHKKNPYPTKAEKIMLAIITRMTLTQVSTWFANARRRLKKENKLYNLDRDKADRDNEDQDDFEDEYENRSQQTGSDQAGEASDTEDINVDLSDCPDSDDDDVSSTSSARPTLAPTGSPARPPHDFHLEAELSQAPAVLTESADQLSLGCSARTLQSSTKQEFQKPKIWSISEIISEASPRNISPPPAYLSRVYPLPPVPQLAQSAGYDRYKTSLGATFPFMNISFRSSHPSSYPALISATPEMSSVMSSPPSLPDPELLYAASRLRQSEVATLAFSGRPTKSPPPCPQYNSVQAAHTAPDTGEPPMSVSHEGRDETSKTGIDETGPKTPVNPEESSQQTCELGKRRRHPSGDFLPTEELSAASCQVRAPPKHSQKTTVIKHPPPSSQHQSTSVLPHRSSLPKQTPAHQHSPSFRPNPSETFSRSENHVPHKAHPSPRHHDSQELLECYNPAAAQVTRRAQDALTIS